MRWGAFGIENTSKLTGLSRSQLERWDRNGFFVPSLADPDRRRHHSRTYSFEDVVGLRAIALLLDLGVSHSSLKTLNGAFAGLNDKIFAERKFYVAGKKVYLTPEEAVSGRTDEPEPANATVVSLAEVVREVEARVEGLSRRSPDQFGQVTRNRYIMNGHPILAGTRIPTASISRLIEKGYSQAFLLEQFPRLTSKDIEGAVRFEASQRRNVAAN